MGYKIVIAHGLGLLPEYSYSASASPWLVLYSGYHACPWAITTRSEQRLLLPQFSVASHTALLFKLKFAKEQLNNIMRFMSFNFENGHVNSCNSEIIY